MILLGGITLVVLLAVISPIVMVVVMSFTTAETPTFPPPGWSLRWYESILLFVTDQGAALGSGRFMESVATSLLIGAVVMVLAVAVGVPASYALVRYRFPGKLFVEQLISLSLVFPAVVMGIALLMMTSRIPGDMGFAGIVTAHVIITFPFVVRNCTAALRGVSVTLEEAARTLGAGWWRTFYEVVFPLMRPGILAGGLIAFILSFNEFTVTYFLYTVDVQPFPIWLFSRSNTSLDPTIFALASVVIIFDVILIWFLDRIAGNRSISL